MFCNLTITLYSSTNIYKAFKYIHMNVLTVRGNACARAEHTDQFQFRNVLGSFAISKIVLQM